MTSISSICQTVLSLMVLTVFLSLSACDQSTTHTRSAQGKRDDELRAENDVASAEIAKTYTSEEANRIVLNGDLKALKMMLDSGYCSDCSDLFAYYLMSVKQDLNVYKLLIDYSTSLNGYIESGVHKSLLSATLNKGNAGLALMLLNSGKKQPAPCDKDILNVAGSGKISDEDTLRIASLIKQQPNFSRCEGLRGNIVNLLLLMNKPLSAKWIIIEGWPVEPSVFQSLARTYDPDRELMKLLLQKGGNINFVEDSLTPLELRLSSSNPFLASDEELWRSMGAKANMRKVQKQRVSYEDADNKLCLELNQKFMTGLSKGLRGEKLAADEDMPIPAYCRKYLN